MFFFRSEKNYNAGAEAAELQTGGKQRKLEHDEQHYEPASGVILMLMVMMGVTMMVMMGVTMMVMMLMVVLMMMMMMMMMMVMRNMTIMIMMFKTICREVTMSGVEVSAIRAHPCW